MAIACTVEEINLLQCQTTEVEDGVNMSHGLLINDIQLPDPFTIDMINDFKQCPLVLLI